MYFTRPGIHVSMALAAMTFVVAAPDTAADNLGQLPATKHQLESIKDMTTADTPRVAASASKGLELNGAQEVPTVDTAAHGHATITVGPDKAISGGVSTTGIEGTAAHIHDGAVGKNGPVLITLLKDGENGWLVPADSTLTDAQYASFKAGALYINVHSAAHGDGEIRAQVAP